MSIAIYKCLQREYVHAIGTDQHEAAEQRLAAANRVILPLLVGVAEAAELLRTLQLRGARDPNEHAMIEAAGDRLDRAISKLEGVKP
jgi:bifunctional DNase/RNase